MSNINETKLRIAHVIDSLGHGGAEQALVNLAPRFEEHNIKLVVIPLFTDRALAQDLHNLGIEVAEVHFSNKWNILKNVRLLTEFLRSENIQIVHAHLIFSGIYVGLTKLLKLPIIRVISFHNLAYSKGCNPINVSYFLRKTLNWFVLRYCYDQILAVSSAVSEHYCYHFGLREQEIDILPNGLPVEEYEQFVPVFKEVCEPLKITALGRLVKEKGYEYLLTAFAELQKATDVEIRLCIIGGGPLENALKQQTLMLGITESVTYTGGINHAQAMNELSKTDIYVLSSIFEGFGLAVAEAILLEKPVVVTKVGGVMDIVNDTTAILIEPADSQSLAEGLQIAMGLTVAERKERVEKAKTQVIEHYSIEKVVEKLSYSYTSLLSLQKKCEQHV